MRYILHSRYAFSAYIVERFLEFRRELARNYNVSHNIIFYHLLFTLCRINGVYARGARGSTHEASILLVHTMNLTVFPSHTYRHKTIHVTSSFVSMSIILFHTFILYTIRYHLQSDELLGSWLFVGANLPFIPYALLYLATEESNLEYLGALAISVCLMIGSGLFVMCCYPSDKVSFVW